MDEKLMHRRLRRTAVIIVLISLLLILLEGIAMISFQKNLNETIKQRITGEAEEYQSMIMDQIYANLQSPTHWPALSDAAIWMIRNILPAESTRQIKATILFR